MEREISRDATLPAYSFYLSDMETLIGRLTGLLDVDSTQSICPYIKINVELKNEKLSFDSIEEIRTSDFLPDRLDKWGVYIASENQTIRITSNGTFGNFGAVSVTADNEAWCAGAVESVLSYCRSRKKWYSFFMRLPLGWVYMLFALMIPFLEYSPIAYQLSFKASLPIYVVLGLLYLIQKSLLKKSSVLIVRESKNRFREYVPEMSLVAAIVAVIIALFKST